MVKITYNNHYLESQRNIETIDEQIRELKRIIPEQGIFKRRVEKCLLHWISIKDRRYRSMSSSFMAMPPFTNDGVEVVSINVETKIIHLEDSGLFEIIKDFANRWGYKEINTEYQM